MAIMRRPLNIWGKERSRGVPEEAVAIKQETGAGGSNKAGEKWSDSGHILVTMLNLPLL